MQPTPFVADFWSGALPWAVIGFGLVVVIPIVGIMASHQREMAKLLKTSVQKETEKRLDERIDQLQSELSDLRQRQLPPASTVPDRLKE